MLTNDYRTTARICEKKLLEGGYAYLVSVNERWTTLHIKILIHFHKRICFCMMDLIHIRFLELSLGMKSRESVEAYVDAMLGKCFDLFVPIIGIIQGIVEESEVEQLYRTFAWMEEYNSMQEYLMEDGKFHKANRKLAKMLEKDLKEDALIQAYEASKG